MRINFKNYASPAGTGTTYRVVLYEDQKIGLPAPIPSTAWIIVAANLDQTCTVYHEWAPDRDADDSALVIMNANGVGDSAGLRFSEKYRRLPGRNRVSIVAPGTAPTATKLAVEEETFDGAIV